jgi:hypothetical protein
LLSAAIWFSTVCLSVLTRTYRAARFISLLPIRNQL